MTNIVATIPGASPSIVVIGGHYDSAGARCQVRTEKAVGRRFVSQTTHRAPAGG